ncbi:hypothetical protein D3C87_944460 [compost metagenome]
MGGDVNNEWARMMLRQGDSSGVAQASTTALRKRTERNPAMPMIESEHLKPGLRPVQIADAAWYTALKARKWPLPKTCPPPLKRPIRHSRRITMPAWGCMAMFKGRCKTLKRRPWQKGSPRVTTNGGYIQLPGTEKALLVENCATDGDPSPQLLVRQHIHLRLKSEHANQKESSACCFSNQSDNESLNETSKDSCSVSTPSVPPPS